MNRNGRAVSATMVSIAASVSECRSRADITMVARGELVKAAVMGDILSSRVDVINAATLSAWNRLCLPDSPPPADLPHDIVASKP
jgi:hypothetical protein